MARSLRKYQSKRDLSATPEPAGTRSSAVHAGAQPRFVVQQHAARSLHWDLRLERDGVLVSWAVPKGIPEDPKRNHLAVHVEDHPLDYIDFAGEIPAGNYGAGTVQIWDSGTYEEHKFRDDEVIVTLHGERVSGRYALFQTDGANWMIHRMDPPADAGREPLPDQLAPMLASPGVLPRDDGAWAYEVKWDGVRVLALIEGGRVRLRARSGRDISARYPELRGLGAALGTRTAILDGEVVALDEDGRPSFERLQRRMHLGSDAAVRRIAAELPVVYMLFDVPFLDGHSLCPEPYTERRARLESLQLDGPTWRTPSPQRADGAAMLAATRKLGIEGVVAKRLDSRYEPGRRSPAWVKVRNIRRTQVVIGGWMPGAGARSGKIGALLAGVCDDAGRLVYVGRVGSGFSEAELARLQDLLEPLRSDSSPFAGRQPPRSAIFVQPKLVAEVAFAEWTRARTLRQPSYKGLRDDLDPRDAVFEAEPTDAPPAASDDLERLRAAVRRSGRAARSLKVEIEGRELTLSNVDKVLYPAAGFTKGQVIDYYANV
ncbi:MAG TPA: non-homologous end-joining DNA ligase, partial [Solirubrobacteraceae bacterium]|nr:non-homologous end-joining DNA ligase [Solirubrobacteraceae bacterium]